MTPGYRTKKGHSRSLEARREHGQKATGYRCMRRLRTRYGLVAGLMMLSAAGCSGQTDPLEPAPLVPAAVSAAPPVPVACGLGASSPVLIEFEDQLRTASANWKADAGNAPSAAGIELALAWRAAARQLLSFDELERGRGCPVAEAASTHEGLETAYNCVTRVPYPCLYDVAMAADFRPSPTDLYARSGSGTVRGPKVEIGGGEGRPVVCTDGTLSYSGGVQGACSSHGGTP